MSNPPFQSMGGIRTYRSTTAIALFTVVLAAVGGSSSTDVATPSAANQPNVVGVATTAASGSGQPVEVMTEGLAKIVAGETLAHGDLLGHDATGRAIKWRGGGIVGIAMTAASADEYVSAQLMLSFDQSIVKLVAASGGVVAKTLGIAGAVAGEVSPAGADQASKVLGVILNTAAAGAPVFVKTFGLTRLTASAAIAYGDTVGSAASGLGKTYSAGQKAGIAMSAAAGAATDFDFMVSPTI